MTIVEAIRKVMQERGLPMTFKEVYSAIAEKGLYEFHSANAAGIVRAQIRRHCAGLDFPSAASTKFFQLVEGSRYTILDLNVRVGRSPPAEASASHKTPGPDLSELFAQIKVLHGRYLAELKARILGELRTLSPSAFESFSRRLLEVYGFTDTYVTRVSGDGGIDGHGRLKVGLAHLNIAYQCKRWSTGRIHRPEIDKFRGAIQGKYEQGVFLTTSKFSNGAISASVQHGAVPIVLVDGIGIVELMIEKTFGVQVENFAIPSVALDLALEEEPTSRTT